MHIRTLRVDALDEAVVTSWLGLLDPDERRRAERFVFPRHRLLFIAAHALLRATLAALAGCGATELRFVAGVHGKPTAWLDSGPAPLSFNLSHTDGIAGLAAIVQPGRSIGFDLEPLSRRVNLAVADRFFTPAEIAWLRSLAEDARRDGFLRLWTLKEAFLKATGKGLTQNLASFWFDVLPLRIHFTPQLREDPTHWRFEQRILHRRFLAAVGLHSTSATPVETTWIEIAAGDISAGLAPLCSTAKVLPSKELR